MSQSDWNYSQRDLVDVLQKVGLSLGDTVFVHVCLDELGQIRDATNNEQQWNLVLDALQGVVGEKGTILVPTYTFSFCEQKAFDVDATPTEGGPWSTSAGFLEYVRNRPGAVRSRDPIHSVAAIGPGAHELLSELPNTCFGEGSIFHRLRDVNAKICLIGAAFDEATFRHHVEEIAKVPFRFNKLFTGQIRESGVSKKLGWIYNVRVLADNCYPDASRLEERLTASGVCRIATLGRGRVRAFDASAFYDQTALALDEDPWFTARGPAGDPVEFERERVGGPTFDVSLPPNASMTDMVENLWRLPRDIVSEAYDAALNALSTQLPMTIHEYRTGTPGWSWIIPERWTCHEAYLETLDGTRLFSYADNPLHVVSYSLPFEGTVTREELLKHLHIHWKLPHATPFIFKYYERDWGLCCSRNLRDSLTDDAYRVVIRTDFSFSTLKVGEVVARGASDDCVVLCAHLCHPAMANDDLSGVIVGMQVMKELLKRRDLRYTYRYLIVPETIGSVAYLSHNVDLVPHIKGGLFLEMMGLQNPHALQLSFDANTELDECFRLALKAVDYHGWTGPYRTVIGNDERQFNGPGMRLPMLSLSRVLPESSPNWPYPEYHSDCDNPDLLSIERLKDSANMVLKMIDTFETNCTPVNNYNGEVFCSRYGIFIDGYTNPEGNRQLFNVMDRIDGTRSMAQIAMECNVPFDAVKGVVDELAKYDLVDRA